MEKLFEKYVREKIQRIPFDEKNIVVLKGIPIKFVDANSNVDIESAGENPAQYFYKNIA